MVTRKKFREKRMASTHITTDTSLYFPDKALSNTNERIPKTTPSATPEALST
jgi:hypothetical protein